jgi:ATP-dependent DNA ligase
MPGPVTLQPPVAVLRPVAARTIPAERALPGGVQYTVKLDGFRCVAFRLEDRVYLQSRSGRDLGREFPQVASAVAELPAGTVLDGEICAAQDGRFEFEQLLRTPAGRTAAIVYVAFDLLAVPGRLLLDEPLSERWRMLEDVVDAAGPLVQLAMATTDRTEAATWYETLVPAGVEGIVAKGLADPYRHGVRWVKTRHAETIDARVVAVRGPARRPRAVEVELPDGRVAATSRLDAVQARSLGRALADHVPDPEATGRREVHGPLVEVRAGSGRHGTVRFVRVRHTDA